MLAIAALLLVLAAAALAWSTRLKRLSGLPVGHVLASSLVSDARGKPLYSARYSLTGTPDYIVATSQGLVPVELKPQRTESEPHESHLLQVLAYCLLIEETERRAPPYGLLKYSTETFRVDYNPQTRAHLLGVLNEMREAATTGEEPHRNHDSAGRCRACAYRAMCEETLS